MAATVRRPLILLLCAEISGCAVTGNEHIVDPSVNVHGRSIQFIQQFQKVLQHGNLADVKVLESTLGGHLELYRERAHEDETNRGTSYSYQWKSLPFPVREFFPKLKQHGDPQHYHAWYYVSIPAGEKQAQASLRLELNDEPPACLSIVQVQAVLGPGREGNPFNTSPHAKRLRQLYGYWFTGANNIMVFFSTVYGGNKCVYEIFAHQNYPNENSEIF